MAKSRNLFFSSSDKFVIREKSDCIPKSGDTHSYGELWKQDEKKFKVRRSVEFSSAAARCILGGLMDTATGKPVATKEESGNVNLSESETWSYHQEEAVLGGPIAHKKSYGETLCIQWIRLPGKSKSWKTEWSHRSTRVSSHNSSIWKQSSRSSGESTDENMATLWMIWTWMWLFGAYFWMPPFEQQFMLDKTTRRIYDT